MAYRFPLMPPAEIVQCLAELGLPFSEAALAKPEAEAVTKLFEELVMSQTGVTRCAEELLCGLSLLKPAPGRSWRSLRSRRWTS